MLKADYICKLYIPVCCKSSELSVTSKMEKDEFAIYQIEPNITFYVFTALLQSVKRVSGFISITKCQTV